MVGLVEMGVLEGWGPANRLGGRRGRPRRRSRPSPPSSSSPSAFSPSKHAHLAVPARRLGNVGGSAPAARVTKFVASDLQ